MGFHLFRERTRVPTKTGDSFLHTRYAWPPNEKLVQCDVEKCFDKKDHFLLLSFLNESFGKENKETFYRPSYMFHLTGKKIKTKGFTPLLGSGRLGRKTRRVEYESIHQICFKCGRYGHSREECVTSKQLVAKEPVSASTSERTGPSSKSKPLRA